MIRRDVHERLGFYCEDYGLRARLAGYLNAYMVPLDHVRHLTAMRSYGKEHDVIRTRRYREQAIYQFHFNACLFSQGIRPLNVGRRYVSTLDGGLWDNTEEPGYAQAMARFDEAEQAFSKAISAQVEHYIAKR